MTDDLVNETYPIVVLSGKTGVGKTTVAEQLATRLPAILARTSAMILRLRPNTAKTRSGLQEGGNSLDIETDFSWIAREALQLANENTGTAIVVDAVRIPRQVSHIRAAIARPVVHVHLTASRAEIIARFTSRNRSIDDGLDYEAIEADISEKWDVELAATSDLVLNTDRDMPVSTASAIIAFTKP